MTNSEIYNTIAESLQCDIDTNAISYEYASIINDIAYDKFITESELPENVESVLDRYISEAAGDDESTDELDSMLEMVNTIEATYESGDITNVEYGALLESVIEKIDAYTESFAGAGGARGKYAEINAKTLVGTLDPIIKAVKDYYKREIIGNHLKTPEEIAKVKQPSVGDLVTKAKLPQSVIDKNKKAHEALKEYSSAGLDEGLDMLRADSIVKHIGEEISGINDQAKIFTDIDETRSYLKKEAKGLIDDIRRIEANIDTNTVAKRKFKAVTGGDRFVDDSDLKKQKEHDEKLAMLKKRNAEKMAKNK